MKSTHKSPQRKARPQEVARPIARVMWADMQTESTADYLSLYKVKRRVQEHTDFHGRNIVPEPVAVIDLTQENWERMVEAGRESITVIDSPDKCVERFLGKIGLTAPDSRQSRQGAAKGKK